MKINSENLIYLGTVAHYNRSLNFIKLKEIAEGYEIKEDCHEIYIGFSRNFLEKILIRNFDCTDNSIIVYLIDNANYDNNQFINKAVFVEDKFLVNIRPDLYLVSDLIGCKVLDSETGNIIGMISDVSILPGNDVWFIRTESGEMPIPVINEVIRKVDINTKTVYIKLLDGLVDLIILTKNDKKQ